MTLERVRDYLNRMYEHSQVGFDKEFIVRDISTDKFYPIITIDESEPITELLIDTKEP